MCLALILLLIQIPVGSAAPITITVNGIVLECDTPPFIENGTVMVPLKSIFEALGAVIKWDGAANAVIIKSKGLELILEPLNINHE